jgi:hypothetical protein
MRTSKIILVVAMIAFLATGMVVFADSEHERSVDSVVAEILSQAQAESLEDVTADEVSAELLEELGDAVMEEYSYGTWQHTMMDYMIGGEDARELADFHRSLGRDYIASGGEIPYYGPRRGGGWMHGYNRYAPVNSAWDRYGYSENRWYVYIPYIVGGILLFVVLVVAILLLKKRKPGHPALNIIQQRFARGEISKEEYDRMIRVIRS